MIQPLVIILDQPPPREDGVYFVSWDGVQEAELFAVIDFKYDDGARFPSKSRWSRPLVVEIR